MAERDEAEGRDVIEAQAKRAIDEMDRQLDELRTAIAAVFKDGKADR